MKFVVPDNFFELMEESRSASSNPFAPFEKGLTTLIQKSDDDSLIIAIDDKWGAGKTTFVKHWCKEVGAGETAIETIYFDAFSHDYQDDPLLALATEIYGFMVKKDASGKTLGNVKKLSSAVAASLGNQLIKALTKGAIDAKELVKDFNDVRAGLQPVLEQHMEKAGERAQIIESFKDELKRSIEKLEGRKLVFVIDELDRCRPDFALDLLEKVKHIFAVKGLVFLLVMSKGQFSKSIKMRYGEINSDLYLQKFIHFSLSLPKRNFPARNLSQLGSFFDVKRDSIELSGILLLETLLTIHEASFRQAGWCISVTLRVFALMEGYLSGNLSCIVLICFLKEINPDLLGKLKNKNISYAEAEYAVFLNKDNIVEEKGEERNCANIRDILRIALGTEEERRQVFNERSAWARGAEQMLPSIIEACETFVFT